MALSLGLLNTLHCWGMCGGLVAALQLGIPEPIRQDRVARLRLTTCYHLGRIASYSLAGALSGSVLSLAGEAHAMAYRLLQTLAAITLVIAGLRLGGWLQRVGFLERAGAAIWRRISPLTRALLPVDRISRALASGALWGLIPCGLVYAMLPVSAATGSPARGALCMLAFGAGTLPGMLAASLMAGQAAARLGLASWRKPAGVAMIALALCWWLFQNLDLHGQHAGMHADHLHHHATPPQAP
jgi:sulfite exporter TauE/SafE